MTCNSCGKKKKTCDNKEFTKAVVEINNPETNVLIRKVVIPASLGDDTTNPPVVGRYCNVVLFYEANWHVYLYSSDGIPTLISDNGDVDFDRIQNRPWYDGAPMTSETRIPKVPSAVSELNNDKNYQTASQVSTTVSNAVAAEANIRQGADETLRNDIDAEVLARQNAITTLTNEINRDVMYDLEMSTSAQSVSFKEDKINVVTGVTSTEIDTIPAASSTTAGIITAAEYATLVDSEEKIEALLNGAVAITGLPSTPTQAELTTTWKNATGRDTLINRASIFDVDNQLVWTYYTNVDTWESAPSGQVSVSQFGNGTPGIITGSTLDGNVSANLDGTGTVSGWTTVKNDIATNTAAIATKANITDIPTVNNATLTIQKNGSNVATFTANSATNTTANITVPTVDPDDFFTSDATDNDKDNPIRFEGTVEEKLVGITLVGDTSQTTYTGKNLVYTTGKTENGITATYDAFTGITTVSGTATTTYAVFGTNSSNIPAGTYTFSIQSAAPVGVGIGTRVGGGARVARPISAGNTKVTFTVTGAITSYDIYLTGLTAGTSYNFSFQAQLESGSSATSFEPYVKAIPSPNPDYPQNIKVVTGEQSLRVNSDNIFNTYEIDDSGHTTGVNVAIDSNGVISLSNNPGSNGYCRMYTKLKNLMPSVKAGDTCYLYVNNTFGSGTRNYIYLYGSNFYWNSGTAHTITQAELNGDLAIYGGYQATTSLEISVSVENISKYTPYRSQEYKINLGKNLFDKDHANTLQGYFDGSVPNPVIVMIGGARNRLAYIPCNPNTVYSMSVDSMTGLQQIQAGTTSQLPAADVAVTSLGTFANMKLENKVTPSNANYIILRIQSSIDVDVETVLPTILGGLQIEKGSAATTYASYKTPIELCKIDSYQDYFYKDGDDWYLHKETNKLNMKDYRDKSWYISQYEGNSFVVKCIKNDLNIPDMLFDAGSTVPTKDMCNYFTASPSNSLYRGEILVGFGITTDGMYFSNNSWSIDTFKNFIDTHNVIIYYRKNAATNTKITDAELITQLNAVVDNAYSYNDVTILSAKSLDLVDLPFIIDATVLRDGLAGLRQIVDAKQDDIIAGNNITITDNVISATVPTVNNATLTIQENGTNVATFTANSSTNATANITVPTITMTSVDPGEGSPLAANNFIAVYEA